MNGKKSKDMETNNRNSNTHLEGERIYTYRENTWRKDTDNLIKLMKAIRLLFKRVHKELSRRAKWRKNSFRYIIGTFRTIEIIPYWNYLISEGN